MVPGLIYDVGMHNGDDTAYYLWRGFNVIAVEADPALAAAAAMRFYEEIKSGQIKILNIGIAAEDGEFAFWICETDSHWNSLDRELASRNCSPHHEIRVPCRNFAGVIEEFGIPHYLKIDIEGRDTLCVQALDRGALPEFISIEVAGDDGLKQLALLRERGFKRFKAINQVNYLPLQMPASIDQRRHELELWLAYSKNPLLRAFRFFGARRWIHQELKRHRTYHGWSFPFGSSGPFGDDLPGRWLSYDEMQAAYQQRRTLIKGEYEGAYWYDFHARCN
jgi:FkbM family methyltransferase